MVVDDKCSRPGDACHQGRVRGLWLAPSSWALPRFALPKHAGGARAARLGRRSKEDQATDAGAWSAAAATSALRRDDRQRPRPTHLSGSCQGAGRRWPQPALGGGSDRCRDRRRLCLRRGDDGRLVAPHRRPRNHERPWTSDRRTPHPGRPKRRDRSSPPAAELYPPRRSRVPIRRSALSGTPPREQTRRLEGPARQYPTTMRRWRAS
jgi:hypothetical protein